MLERELQRIRPGAAEARPDNLQAAYCPRICQALDLAGYRSHGQRECFLFDIGLELTPADACPLPVGTPGPQRGSACQQSRKRLVPNVNSGVTSGTDGCCFPRPLDDRGRKSVPDGHPDTARGGAPRIAEGGLRRAWSGHRLDRDAVLPAGVLEPRPQVVSEGASNVNVEAGTLLRAVVHQVDQDRGFREQALGAAAGRKCPRVQIQRAALGEHIARARAGDRNATLPSVTSVMAACTPASAARSDASRPGTSRPGQVTSHWSGPSQGALI